ncbi:carbamoyltransferase HypF [Terasakiella sp. A23]|uniref:carbamoyltransferase HypF n=1 Tax=Terasakiella sp. FCG-A23 TaxID=3080561 RepID=UPI002955CF6C|nr:carbamoyltransferase HypF [Terasakiella sp. A23]MDV7338303.1 carbamoyltransferase HypF [Terasakiella sp. A23]
MTGSNPVSMLQKIKRKQFRINGSVQGVGFRPFIYSLASELGLTGWVLNDGEGVLVEVQGIKTEIFASELYKQRPQLSRIDHIKAHDLDLIAHEEGFIIQQSRQTDVLTDIPPDSGTCPDCLAEMCDPDNRRFGYPFINCTHCGPRYTITRSLPYDRPQTSMADFKMCAACEAEYHDPANRRFHAQPTCCPDCGPKLSHNIAEIADQIREGRILAIKGLGGFHLVCDAQNEDTIRRLRERKNRDTKPFAVMVPDCSVIKEFARLSETEQAQLESPKRPIVLLMKQCPDEGRDLSKAQTSLQKDPGLRRGTLPDAIAPGLKRIGIMLPYTPIHHLLMDALNGLPLVMTSANPGGEPLVIDNEEARIRLDAIADIIVDHNRDILIRVDDSVVRMDGDKPTFIRRARGFTPSPIILKNDGPSVLALGAYLKNTICVTRDDHAYLSQHIGDLDTVSGICFLEETIDHMCQILKVKPDLVVSDLHPNFASTRHAETMEIENFQVQHHHAHIASVIAEHHIDGPVIGVALDGFGLGHKGDSWGGELLLVNGLNMTRLGHFQPLAQPGADKAAIEPWRMGASALYQMGRADEIESRFQNRDGKTLKLMLEKGLNAPMTSSAGRLFDAAAALLGVSEVSDFEGQAPMMLESLVTQIEIDEEGWLIEDEKLNFLPLLEKLCDRSAVSGANLFHGTLIAALTDWISKACQQHGIKQVALSGGCFLNQILSQGLTRQLQKAGLTPYLNQQAPLSDAGLSLGQAWLGQKYLMREQ